jgi:hypothetical protein
LTGIGIAAGLICSVAAATLMRKLPFGTQAWDPMTLTAVTIVLFLSVLLASFLPARAQHPSIQWRPSGRSSPRSGVALYLTCR